MRALRYVGIWSGGAGYSDGEWSMDAEGFRSIEHAKQVLSYRHAGRYLPHAVAPSIVEWDDAGKPVVTDVLGDSFTPAVDESSTIILASLKDVDLHALETDGPYACDWQVEFGPRGGIVVIAL